MLEKAYFYESEFEQEELLRNYLKIILIRLEQKKRSFTQKQNDSVLALTMRFKEVLDRMVSYKIKVADVCDVLGVNAKRLNSYNFV